MTFKRRGGRKPVEGAADDGACRSAAEIAKAERVTRGFINRLLRLTLLAPDVVEGSSPKPCVYSRVTSSLPQTARSFRVESAGP
jgi:hypothetical protein